MRLFIGDTLFMPDYGTARCDFPGGDARQLYRSMQRILSLPRDTRLFMCHDYKAPGREVFAWETTIGEQLERNVHVGGGVAEEDYVAMRTTRDATLKVAQAALSRNPGEHPRRQASAGGREWRRYIKLPLSVA